MDRRDFLKSAAAAMPMLVAGRVWAAPKADMRTLVVVGSSRTRMR